MSISVVILTLDEETNLAGCLESVRWCDDVVVLDSFSRDRTAEIAQRCGARLELRAFDDYASQRNHALHGIRYRHGWVLMLDADERVPDDLRRDMLAAVEAATPDVTLFRMRRKDHLFGRWIRGSSGYPTWFGRLMRPDRVRVERAINEEYRTDGQVRELPSHLHHFPFNKGFAAWIQKHDRYSTMEAELRLQKQGTAAAEARLLARDPTERRRALKALLYRMPLRPVIVFCGIYLGKGGIVEGRAGLTFSLLRAWYEYMIDCKTLELQRRARGLPV
ncbi:MAG TPA: glycosyltransferase family 2 protein [Steroidobacteraceae bacterium]|nr:glycosyltransferase family 2 protein [Steroidobacteraceae bacterium]